MGTIVMLNHGVCLRNSYADERLTEQDRRHRMMHGDPICQGITECPYVLRLPHHLGRPGTNMYVRLGAGCPWVDDHARLGSWSGDAPDLDQDLCAFAVDAPPNGKVLKGD